MSNPIFKNGILTNRDEPIYLNSNFSWGEALWQPSWSVFHIPSDAEITAITNMAVRLDHVRDIIDRPFAIHCWLRSGSVNNPSSPYHGQDYNSFVKGAKMSEHKFGNAVDFHVKGLTIIEAWSAIRDIWKGRMEDVNSTPSWVHCDLKSYGSSITFKP